MDCNVCEHTRYTFSKEEEVPGQPPPPCSFGDVLAEFAGLGLWNFESEQHYPWGLPNISFLNIKVSSQNLLHNAFALSSDLKLPECI